MNSRLVATTMQSSVILILSLAPALGWAQAPARSFASILKEEAAHSENALEKSNINYGLKCLRSAGSEVVPSRKLTRRLVVQVVNRESATYRVAVFDVGKDSVTYTVASCPSSHVKRGHLSSKSEGDVLKFKFENGDRIENKASMDGDYIYVTSIDGFSIRRMSAYGIDLIDEKDNVRNRDNLNDLSEIVRKLATK